MSGPLPPSVSEQTASGPLQWVDQHGDALFRYAMLQLGDRDSAEECVQEAFLAALGARASFRSESSERTWLIGILRHKIADHFRRHRRRAPTDMEASATAVAALFDSKGIWRSPPGPWSGKPQELLERAEFRAALAECLGRLPASMREPFCLRELHALPSPAICQALDLTATNLWTLLHRARILLRECLDANWFGRQGASGEAQT